MTFALHKALIINDLRLHRTIIFGAFLIQHNKIRGASNILILNLLIIIFTKLYKIPFIYYFNIKYVN
jgi:hypothetical protein